MTTRKRTTDETRRLYAPRLSAALNREASFSDAAAAALDTARHVYSEAGKLQLEGEEIISLMAEQIFRVIEGERRELPKREERAAAAALAGAQALLALQVNKLKAMIDEHNRRADQK